MEFWISLLTSPIILITAVIIGSMGEVGKRAVSADKNSVGWKRVYYVTLPAHPVLIGVSIAFIPWLPPADVLAKEGFELAGRVGTYGLAGVVCKVGYDTIIATVRRAINGAASAAGGAVGGAVGGSVAPPPSSEESGVEEPSRSNRTPEPPPRS